MINLFRFTLFICSLYLPQVYAAQPQSQYQITINETRDPHLLPFANKAACAADSKLPASSAFLIVDSYNAGKLVDSFLRGAYSSVLAGQSVEQGLKLFRLSLSQTWMTITQELLAGRLPLLSAQPDLRNLDPDFSRALVTCEQRFPCAAMDAHLEKIFKNWKALPAMSDQLSASKFNLDPSTRSTDGNHERIYPKPSCLYVKRFSEYQSNWNHDRPDQALIQKIAMAALAKKDLFASCFDESESLSSRRFILQVDLSEVERSSFKEHGFDFWYSVKIYFSYAWRHPEFILDSAHPLSELFKNLAIEQMMQVVSADCRSIERPECSQSQVSLDIYSALAKMGSPTELDKPLPDRPEQVLINHPLDTTRENAGVMPENLDSDLWIKSYQDRILQRRGQMKQRLLLAITQFELLTPKITSIGITKELSLLKDHMATDQKLYQKMQVLCSEIDVAARPAVALLEKRFETTLAIPNFKMLLDSSSDLQLSSMLNFYRSISTAAFSVCDQIRKENSWTKNQLVPVTAYAAWYRDLIGTWSAPIPKLEAPNSAPDFLAMGDLYNTLTSRPATYLAQEKIGSSGKPEHTTVCTDASDCVRMLLKSMVDLYAVSAWTDALMPLNEWIQSPSLANQWASATSCKVYDPWFVTKQSIAGLFTDFVSTTVTGFVPVPAYVSAQKRTRTVIGFSTVVGRNDVFLRPLRKGNGAELTLGIDLGPWTGIPCAALVSPTSTVPNINGFYSVASIKVQACSGKDNNHLVVNDASTAGENKKQTLSACLMCYLNPYASLRGVAAIASFGAPALRIAAGVLFSGLAFAKKMHDQVDVPRRYTVNVDEVTATFEKFSFIPKHCVKRLSNGKSCLHPWLLKSERTLSSGQQAPEGSNE